MPWQGGGGGFPDRADGGPRCRRQNLDGGQFALSPTWVGGVAWAFGCARPLPHRLAWPSCSNPAGAAAASFRPSGRGEHRRYAFNSAMGLCARASQFLDDPMGWRLRPRANHHGPGQRRRRSAFGNCHVTKSLGGYTRQQADQWMDAARHTRGAHRPLARIIRRCLDKLPRRRITSRCRLKPWPDRRRSRHLCRKGQDGGRPGHRGPLPSVVTFAYGDETATPELTVAVASLRASALCGASHGLGPLRGSRQRGQTVHLTRCSLAARQVGSS